MDAPPDTVAKAFENADGDLVRSPVLLGDNWRLGDLNVGTHGAADGVGGAYVAALAALLVAGAPLASTTIWFSLGSRSRFSPALVMLKIVTWLTSPLSSPESSRSAK